MQDVTLGMHLEGWRLLHTFPSSVVTYEPPFYRDRKSSVIPGRFQAGTCPVPRGIATNPEYSPFSLVLG